MQFNTLFSLAILALTVSAIPAPVSAPAPAPGLLDDLDFEKALDHLSSKKANGCSLLKCAAALAPTVVSCAAAVAEEGVNVIEDVSCLAEAAKDAIDAPEECTACL